MNTGYGGGGSDSGLGGGGSGLGSVVEVKEVVVEVI